MSVKAKCGAKTKAGTPCKRPAGWGTEHLGYGSCRRHFGNTPSGRAAAARAEATDAVIGLGMAIETDPHEALEKGVAILAGQVSYLQRKVEGLDEAMDGESLHPTLRVMNEVLGLWMKVAKAAADAGTAKRRVDMNEFVLVGLVEAMRRAIADVGTLTNEQEGQLLDRLGHHVRALDEVDDWRAPRQLVAA